MTSKGKDTMAQTLSKSIKLAKLDTTLQNMEKVKSPRLDGIITKKFQSYLKIIRKDFYGMLTWSTGMQQLPTGVKKGLIELLHKGNSRNQFMNWKPITLLNVIYKLFAKTLQF